MDDRMMFPNRNSNAWMNVLIAATGCGIAGLSVFLLTERFWFAGIILGVAVVFTLAAVFFRTRIAYHAGALDVLAKQAQEGWRS